MLFWRIWIAPYDSNHLRLRLGPCFTGLGAFFVRCLTASEIGHTRPAFSVLRADSAGLPGTARGFSLFPHALHLHVSSAFATPWMAIMHRTTVSVAGKHFVSANSKVPGIQCTCGIAALFEIFTDYSFCSRETASDYSFCSVKTPQRYRNCSVTLQKL